MLARVLTSAILGIGAYPVDVEVEIRDGKPNFTVIGLGDGAVRESRDRITSALRHSGFMVPPQILVNLAPAEIKKEGSGFDLAITIGILAASGQIKREQLHDTHFFGELSLDGRLRQIRGTVALAIEALERKSRRVVVPIDNVAETSLVSGLEIFGLECLSQIRSWPQLIESSAARASSRVARSCSLSLDEVRGQQIAKRAMFVAACGGHNLIFVGPPGCGKSMLAERFSTLLPPLLENELLEAVKIHSIAGNSIESILNGNRPFRSPHHSVSDVGLIGGGSVPRPGEISLAHHGVLFLDEIPEFKRTALESLRTPLERGTITVTRSKGRVTLPSSFQLIAAMNPCPCGKRGNPNSTCLCSPHAVSAYRAKVSEPILDRIDLHLDLDAVPISSLLDSEPSVDRVPDRTTVECIRRGQLECRKKLNAKLAGEELKMSLKVNRTATLLLERASKKLSLSARGYFRVLRVARTIADIAEAETISDEHIGEALSYRGFRL